MAALTDPIKAFYFDRGIWMFCSRIEGEMSQAESKARDARSASNARKRVLDKYIHSGVPSGRFKDPGVKLDKKDEEPSEVNLGGDFFA